MPLPQGTVPIGGPIIDTSGALLTASTTLRDNGVISLRGGRLKKVNAAGDGWVDIPGHVIFATEPTETFEGMLWYDTTNSLLKQYRGSAFVTLGGGATITSGTEDPSGGSDGDAYIQIDDSDVVQSLWRNNSGTWDEYTVPASGSGTVTTDAPVSGDGTAGDPVTIENRAIGHVKLGSSVGGVNQAAGRIAEADGAGGVRWANKGSSTGSGEALSSIDFPTPDATNVYDIIDHLGVAYQNRPEVVGASVTWSASVDGDDVSDLWGETTGTYTFRGIEYVSDVTNPQSGDVILLPTGGFRHRGATRFGHLRNPDGWIGGPYDSEGEANNHVTAVNEVSAFADALQLVTAYTAGTTHYQWTNIVEIAPSSALVSRVLGPPTADRLYEIQNFIGELFRVEPRPTGHVVTWDDYALLSDVSTLWGENAGTYRWRGETYPSGAVNPATGDVIKEPAGHFRHRNSSNAWVHLADPDDFIGDYNDETAANNHVTAVGETSLYSHNLHQVATFTEGVAIYVWAKGLDAREVTVDAHAFGGNLATSDTDAQAVADKVDGLTLGPSISDDAPEDIGGTAAAGTGAEVPADDHVHRLPIDNTLEYDSANEQFGVNVQDVIEHLQERVRYFTSSTNYSSDAGASVGQAYNTNQYRKLITKVEVNFDPLVGADAFIVRLRELESNNDIKAKLFNSNIRRGPFGAGAGVRAFTFNDAAGDVGVQIDKGIRLGILLSRLEDDSDSAVGALHGSEASGSPNETYDDASDDFDLDNGIVYQHIDPAVGASTHSHDTQIRGNIKIFYTRILDRGHLVGDGNVNAGHIDSESAADGEVLTSDGDGGAAWEAATGTDDQTAAEVPVTATGFTGNLSVTDDDVQTALGTIDGLDLGGDGTDDQTAAEVPVDTTDFSQNLTATDDTVQAALETIDGFTPYQGAWQQASWPAGVIVTRSGIAYISLVNANTQIPTPASTQWAGLTEGFTYRGEAPVLATNYNYGHVVLDPDTYIYYFFSSTISASVARADIAGHANFQPFSDLGSGVGGGYGDWTAIGSVTGAFSGNPITVALGTDETIDDYEEGYLHSEANNANDQRSISPRFRMVDIPETTLAGGGLGLPFTGNATDEGAVLVRRNAAGDSLVLDAYGSVVNFPATTVTTIYARALTAIETLTVTEERPDFFSAHTATTASSTLGTTPVNKLSINAADVLINRGGFTVEAGTNTLSAVEVASAGSYLVEFNIHATDMVAPVNTRAQIQGDIVVIRAGVPQTDFTARTSMYWRGSDSTDEIYISGTHTVDLLAEDQIEVHFSLGASQTLTWVVGGGESEISIVKIVGTPTASGIVGGAAGQQSEGSNSGGAANGLVRERLYRAVENSVGIGSVSDPPDIWDATAEEFEDDFSPWSRDEPTLTATQVLAVADGYSALDDSDVRQNSAWRKVFSLTEQYCVAIQDNSTYTLDSTEDDLRFVRSLLPTGWGVWQPLEDGSDGWINILTNFRTGTSQPANYHQVSLVDYDARYLREIEFDFETYGTDDNGIIGNRGGRAVASYTRRGHSWSAKSIPTDISATRGSYKLRYNDEKGLDVTAAQGPDFSEEFAVGQNGGTDEPPRKVSFFFHLIVTGTGASQQNVLDTLTIGPHERANQNGLLNVRMR